MNSKLRTPKRAPGAAVRYAPSWVWAVQSNPYHNLVTVWLEPWFCQDANDYVFDVVDVYTKAGTAEFRTVHRRDKEAVLRSRRRVPWTSLPNHVLDLVKQERSRHYD